MPFKPDNIDAGVVLYLDLASLSVGHPLRTAPLSEIGAEFRWKRGGAWKRVLPSFRIARCAFNDLGSAWTVFDDWRARG